jgi:glucosyl-dolichyl phosphate glucuronosyltransferase
MSNPLISVVVCTYNREKFINNCLQSLKNQSLAQQNFEVLVVDNNSKDRSAEIIKEFIALNKELPFFYYHEANQGLSFARNRGIKEAKGTWITYIDDDAEADVDFLKNLKLAIETYRDAVGFGGCVRPKYSEASAPVWMNRFLYGYVGSIDLGPEEKVFSAKMKFPIGCNMTYKKDILDKVAGFNNELQARSDDKYIYYEISKISNRVYYIPNAVVQHNIDKERLLFTSFKKLYMKTGNEEKKRLSNSKILLLKKLLEYFIKLGGAVAIWLIYCFKLQGIKGKYIFLSQYYTLVGFLKKSVFVR